MEEIKLNAEKRNSSGKGVARKLRAGGRIPAALYGPDIDSAPLSISEKELTTLLRIHGSSNYLISLQIDGEEKTRPVIFRALQREPVYGNFEHVDFYQVSPKKKITLTVNVELVGIPEGVKNQGGIVQHIIRELDISCLPVDIPEKVEVDVSEMNIGDSLHVSELSIEKVEILTNPARTLVTVVPPTVVKTAEEEAAEAEELAEGEEGVEGEEGEEGAEGEGAEGGAEAEKGAEDKDKRKK